MTRLGFASSSRNGQQRPAPRMGVVDQVILAFNHRNRLATVLGFVLGGVVPVATYVEAHLDLDSSRPLHAQAAAFMVFGGLVFSAKTVFAWANLAFRDGWKAAGFVVLLEGVMITSQIPVLPLVLLAILVAINGIATGCALSLDRATVRARRYPVLLANSAVAPAPAASDRAEHLATNGAALNTISLSAPQRARKRPSSPQARFSFDVAS